MRQRVGGFEGREVGRGQIMQRLEDHGKSFEFHSERNGSHWENFKPGVRSSNFQFEKNHPGCHV